MWFSSALRRLPWWQTVTPLKMTMRWLSESHPWPGINCTGHTYQYNPGPLCLYMRNKVLDPCTQRAIHSPHSQILFCLLTQGCLKMLQQLLLVLSWEGNKISLNNCSIISPQEDNCICSMDQVVSLICLISNIFIHTRLHFHAQIKRHFHLNVWKHWLSDDLIISIQDAKNNLKFNSEDSER